MKSLKIILITVFSFLLLLYTAFIFALPVLFDINGYLPAIVKDVQDKTGIVIKFKDAKTFSDWSLSAGVSAQRIDLMYSNGEKFAQINDFKVGISTPYLILGKIKFSTIDAQKAFVNLKVDKNGQFLAEKYLKINSEEICKQKLPLRLAFSSSMPDINIEKYRITFIDEKTSKGYFFKGKDFRLSDFILDKKIKLKTQGSLFLDNRKQINYDISLFTKVFPKYNVKSSGNFYGSSIIKIFEDLYIYKLLAQIKADLKISQDEENLKFDGTLDLNNISTLIEGKTLPDSQINLKFSGNKIKINSKIFTSLSDNTTVSGVFDKGKSLNLNVKSKQTDISNAFLIANNICRIFGIKKFDEISADGKLSADFKLKSDFKTVHSKGYLKIEDAKLDYKFYNASLSSIFADIDFSQDMVKVKHAKAFLNSQPVIVKGKLDKSANADLLIEGKNLQLKGLLAALGKKEFLKQNDILNGTVNFNIKLKGKLNNLLPEIDTVFNNIIIHNKYKNLKITIQNAKAVSAIKNNQIEGKIKANKIKISSKNFFKNMILPEVSMSFNKKELNLLKSPVILDNSRLELYGKVLDYTAQNPFFDIKAKGFILSKDIFLMTKNLNPHFAGKIPVNIKIYGAKKQKIEMQMLANKANYVSFVDIKGLKGQTSLLNCDFILDKDVLKIEEIALYSTKALSSLSENFKTNLSSGYKILTLSGKISDINEKASFKDIGINIPSQITVSLPYYPSSSANVKGDFVMNGDIKNPEIEGYLSVASLIVPELNIGLKNMMLHFNDNFISAAAPEVIFANSVLSMNALLLNNFSKGVIVNNIDLTAENLELTDLTNLLSRLPKQKETPGANLSLTILKGTGRLNRFKAADIITTNITSSLSLKDNLLNIQNLKGNCYLGKIAGNIYYDLGWQKLGMDIQGRNLSAAMSIKALSRMKEEINGQLDFDADISMQGQNKNQMLKTLKGNTKFVISNGKMGTLGKLEHLLYAQNIVSNNIFRTNLNLIAKAVSVKNTGVYKYMRGDVNFSNGWANIYSLTTTGPSMSMYITGRYHLIDEVANLTILGRLSDDVVRVLGPLGDVSVDKIISSITKTENTSAPSKQIIAKLNYERIDLIPPLTPKTDLPTKTFKVIIDGKTQSQSSVKSFKWIVNSQGFNTEETQFNSEENLIKPENTQNSKKDFTVPEFVDALPDLKK